MKNNEKDVSKEVTKDVAFYSCLFADFRNIEGNHVKRLSIS